jgi:hypothetical protein
VRWSDCERYAGDEGGVMRVAKIRVVLPLALLLCAVSMTGCSPRQGAGLASPSSERPTTGLPIGGSAAPVPAPGTCRLGSRDGQPLPDRACTPGAINPAVTQANIQDTICKVGWTATVRPPTSVTDKFKRQIDQAYGLPTSTQGELDHEVSLEIGGAPSDPRNLWVEPGKIPNPKDAVENKLNEAVCSGPITLAAAQKAIATSWVTAFDDAGLRVSGGKVCLRAQPGRCASGRHGDSD